MMNKRPRRILKKVRLGALYLPFYRWTFPLPLPFISAGRSCLVTLLAALGVVQSVAVHREEE